MKNTTIFLFLIGSLCACKKNTTNLLPTPPSSTHPQMRYTPLYDDSVGRQHARTLDIDGDGSNDFLFSTLLVADPLLQIDKLQFRIGSGQKRNLLVNEQDETPPLLYGARVQVSHPGFNWYEIGSSILAEKRIGFTETWWEGLWKNATHRFVPVQVERDGQPYNGWVELSMDRNAEKLVLHRAAISLEPGKPVTAGR